MDMFERYSAAQRLLTQHTRNAVLNGRPSVTWMDDFRFSYPRMVRGEQGVETVLVQVDARTGDEEILTEKHSQEEVQYEQETGRVIKAVLPDDVKAAFSPDQKYAVENIEHNLYLVDLETEEQTQLTFDGEKWLEYGCYIDIYSQITVKKSMGETAPNVLWSPDGKSFITYRADRRSCRKLYLLESYVDDVSMIRPELYEYPCPFVADTDQEIPHYTLYVGNVEKKTLIKVDAPDFLYPVYTSAEKTVVRWLDDSCHFYFTWVARGCQNSCMYLGNGADGSVQLLINETTDTFVNHGALGVLAGYGSYPFSNFVTQDRKYAFWQSEKDGYAHLYRFEIDGSKKDVSEGVDLLSAKERTLIVQNIIKVDEKHEKIYFMGNNEPDCYDPIYYQLYVIGFDGSGFARLTPEDATHTVTMGTSAFVDTYSRVDLPPVTVLRDLEGQLIRQLEEADVTDLMALGYQYPERFTVKAEDGTELYGIMVKPADFDPNKTYPVIDYIYGGPQLYNVPRDFTWDNSMNREVMGGLQEFAQLGFVGITIDGRGTPGRGKEFHNHCYRNLHGCAGLSDHVYCAKELKEKFPFMDMDRVGIWGNSGGGYGTVSAMLLYPEFYKVGVASSGNYDQRMYEHSWTERYNGLYDPEVYELGDITRLAKNLKGQLFLAYGAMDDNVTMSQTLRLCDELNKYNKDYNLMVLPRMNHNVPSDLLFIRRKMDFFVKHLLGEEPPKEFVFDCM